MIFIKGQWTKDFLLKKSIFLIFSHILFHINDIWSAICPVDCVNMFRRSLKKSNIFLWWYVDFLSVKKSKGGQADASCDRWVSVGEEGREWKHLFNNFRSTPSTSKSLRTKVSNKWHCQLHSSCRRNLWLNFSCYSGLVDPYIKITGQSQK